jgi:hypothetical protein
VSALAVDDVLNFDASELAHKAPQLKREPGHGFVLKEIDQRIRWVSDSVISAISGSLFAPTT